VLSNARRTIVHEPSIFNLHKNDYLTRARNRALARRAWAETFSAPDGQAASADYGRGFRDGFADYLYAGGTGEPPLVPPRCYWKVGYQSPEGRQAIFEYFEGFRAGVAACQQSGLRQFATVPSSVCCAPMATGYPSDMVYPSDTVTEILPPPDSLFSPAPERLPD
jgi:hypothetical protein